MIELPIVSTTNGTAGSAGRSARAAEWPDDSLVAEARSNPAWNWQPLPFAEVIVKLHGRCNLACDYCYMYEMADQSWRGKPMVMDRATVDQVAVRLREHWHAHADRLPNVLVKLHGGEALMAGPEEIAYAARTLKAVAPPGTDLTLAMTTNGVLLDDPRMLDVIREHGIRISVSLDGGLEANDRHRKYANGKGSHQLVMRGIEALKQHSGTEHLRLLLCTIDVENDPLEVYEALVAVDIPQIDFGLPLGHWSQPPPGWTAPDAGNGKSGEGGTSDKSGDGTAYADWLIPIFDRWYTTTPVPTSVRVFDDILSLVLGGHSTTEGYGLGTFQSLTIDTDGSIELVDTMKSVFDGAPDLGMSVFRDELAAPMLHPDVVARQIGVNGLSQTCLRCPIMHICGGGHYTHRYRDGEGFLNPSVYCADLTKLITHIRDRVMADVHRLAESARVRPE